MRVLIVSNIKPNGYGESTRPHSLGQRLVELGHKVLHVCQKDGVESNTRFVAYNPETSDWLQHFRMFFRLLVSTHLFRPDIIYVHQLNNWTWVRLSKALPKAIRVFDAHTSVFMEHSHFNPDSVGLLTTKIREQNALTEADHIIAASAETKEFFLQNFKVIPEKITVVKNATNLKPLTQLPKEGPLSEFTCSAVLPQDGFESNRLALGLFLDVAKETQQLDPTISFKVIGGGKMPEPKSDNVMFTGFVDDLETAVKTSNVCLVTYPSKAVCGGARNKVCDFLAMGRPIISTTEGMRGLNDCMAGDDYVLAETVSDFAHAIVRLKNTPSERLGFAKKSLKMGSEYQWSKRGDEVLATFDNLLKAT